MKLVHYSANEIKELKNDYKYPNKSCFYCRMKPLGLWVSDDDDYGWRQWCEKNDFCLENLQYSYEIELKEKANILLLKSEEDILHFTAKYKIEDSHPQIDGILWQKVKDDYEGILITPYRNELAYHLQSDWYHGWDCASGCIWDITSIKTFKLRKTMATPIENTLRLLERYTDLFAHTKNHSIPKKILAKVNNVLVNAGIDWTHCSDIVVDCLNERFPEYAIVIAVGKDEENRMLIGSIWIGKKSG